MTDQICWKNLGLECCFSCFFKGELILGKLLNHFWRQPTSEIAGTLSRELAGIQVEGERDSALKPNTIAADVHVCMHLNGVRTKAALLIQVSEGVGILWEVRAHLHTFRS
jgi:hypothetical protein